MPDGHYNVSLQSTELSEQQRALPADFNEFVVACEHLRSEGVLDEIAQRFRLDRRGYQFIDAVVAGLAFFSAYPQYSGLRGMLDEVNRRGWSEALAGLAGRDRMCSQASMSRVLDDIPHEMARDFSDMLLGQWAPLGVLSDYEALLWRDCAGKPWHGFAIDGRVQPFRRRALCEGDEYPPAHRRVDKLGAKPGYSGRKRADVQMKTSLLQHMGSSLYLAMNYSTGNGQLTQDFERGLAQIEGWAKAHDVDPGQCFLAIDGEDGGFPQLRSALRSPVHFVSRLSHYVPLKDPAFRAQLAKQTWQKATDSKSGPERWATEMGDYWLGESQARLVVSCFEPTDGSKSGAGYFVDGLQYEVYACDFDPAAFGAAEVVTTYYARAGRQENGFAHQDRHMDLERLYSDSQPGQMVVMALGMWLHNFRATRGAELFGELEPVDIEPEARGIESAEALPLEPTGSSQSDTATAQTDSQPASSTIGIEAPEAWWQRVTQKVEERIGELDGFSYDAATRQISCAKGVYLHLSGLRRYGDNVALRFRIGPRHQCRGCPFRDGCTSSTSPTYRKEIEITMPPTRAPDDDDAEDAMIDNNASADQQPQASETETEAQSSMSYLGLRPTQPEDFPDTGDFAMRTPVLVASVLRNGFRQAAKELNVAVEVTKPPPDSPDAAYLALTNARRQRRRKTWEERIQWNGLPDQATVAVDIKAPPRAMRLLRGNTNARHGKPLKNKTMD
ncbi:MAG: hypothetical protein ACQEVA_05795 [Myxococcota bacterium]